MKSHKDRLNIGYFTDSYSPQINGVVTSIVSFRNESEKLGNPVYIFAPKMPGKVIDDRRTFRFPSVKSFIYPDFRETLPISPKIIALIPKLHLDLIHVQTPGQIGLLGTHLAIRYNLPVVFTYHTLYPEYFSIYYKKATPLFLLGLIAYPLIIRDPKAYKDLVKIARQVNFDSKWTKDIAERLSVLYSKQMDGLIAPSPKIKKLLLKWGVTKPIKIIPTGIDLAEFKPIKPSFRKERGLEKSLIITYLGRVGQEKNLDLLLSAFKIVSKHIHNAQLVIIGDGPYKKDLQKNAKKLRISNRIIFTGFLKRERAISALKSSDLFVFPSITDTQGLVVIEAAASGLPVILTDREITEVLEDSKNGYYAKNEAKDLAAKITKVLLDEKLRKKFSSRSKELAKIYASSKMTKKLVSFYKELIDAKETKTSRDPKALL